MNDAILLSLAVSDHKTGRLDRAMVQYRRLICCSPTNREASYLLGQAFFQSGDTAEGRRSISRATILGPGVARFHLTLGEMFREIGMLEEARRAYDAAVSSDSQNAEAHNVLGLTLRDLGEAINAIARFDKGLKIAPTHFGLHYNRAMTLQIAGDLESAVDGYASALSLDSGFLDARNNLAMALQRLGRLTQATTEFRRVLVTEPAHAIGWNNLGIADRASGDVPRAAGLFRRATVASPGYAEALNNLGITFWALGDESGAIGAYERAIELRPDLLTVALNLASAQTARGSTDEALATYNRAARHHPSDKRIGFRQTFILPQVYDSQMEIDEYRQRIETFLTSDEAAETTFEDPISDVGSANFYLAYHGRDDRALAERIAAFHRKACPRLSWTAPGCEPGARRLPRRRIRIGVCSKYLNSHTIGLLFEGVLRQLAERAYLELVLLRVPGRTDDISRRIDASADHVLHLPAELVRAQQAIANAEIDILIYTDIGLEPETYFLAFARLAPVQLVTWGHPVTTGLDTLDGFLSADVFEPEDGDAHYSEGLVRTRNIMMHYRPPLAGLDITKTEFGLSESETAYICPQNIFKLHPDYDEFLAGVLRADPHGKVILIESAMTGWTERLRSRLRRNLPDVMDRIVFLPHLPTQQYFRLVSAADVILDPVHFGGGFTTFHALSLGKPLVTLHGTHQRSRFASGTYKLIGLEDLVTTSKDDYVRRAVEFGIGAEDRKSLSNRIREAALGFREGNAAADELYDLLVAWV